ncbi:MAG: winged helix-turn-helix domain-containing protein [Anaerolineae bacterium]|nr:winged helix-turn-helix domain-containing protein [Anaerolineae bacterium]
MTLRFQALGSFAVYRAGQPLPRSIWGSHRALTLAKVLLTHRNQAIHKEQLAEWVWPTASADAAERNLYIATSDLRRALEPDRPPRSPSRYVHTDGDTIELTTNECWVDADLLLNAADVEPTAPHALQRLDEAVRLYGGVYLPDDLYADWAQVERERLALAHETILFKLADAHAARSDYHAAVTACRRGLIRYPLSEAGVARCMRYASRVGETGLALRAYEMLISSLRREMQIEPEPHLARMAERLRQGLPLEEMPEANRWVWADAPVGTNGHGSGLRPAADGNGHHPGVGNHDGLRVDLERITTLVTELNYLLQRLHLALGDLD